MATFRTLAEPSRYLADPIKGSRFEAVLAPATTEAEAMALIHQVQAEAADASHHCWAWLLADGRSRSWDAGEPRGSAGRPILAQIEGHEVVDVVVVVSRWFGGTKLGVGGLIRAYGGTAGKALDRSSIVSVASRCVLLVEHEYDDTGAVQAIVSARHLQVAGTEWGQRVAMRLDVEEDIVDELLRELRDRTAGRAALTVEPTTAKP